MNKYELPLLRGKTSWKLEYGICWSFWTTTLSVLELHQDVLEGEDNAIRFVEGTSDFSHTSRIVFINDDSFWVETIQTGN